MDIISSLQLISAEKVKDVLDYPSLIVAVEKGLGNYSNRAAAGIDQPVRSVVALPKNDGFLGCMPVFSQADDILATKLVTFFPRNKDVPTHNAIVVVFSTETGIPRALLDGEIITARRTAAVSAVATKFQQVRVWNHRPEGAQKLASELGEKCVATATVEEAVKDADVIVTVTSAKEPVLKAQWVKPGAHINAVGACRPDWSELDPELVRSSVVYADSREGALKESGDIILAKADVYAEIGEVINGSKMGRREQITLFKSLGMAIEDGVAAKLVLEKLGI